jgi:Mg2+ and Co2+ transporter CorA
VHVFTAETDPAEVARAAEAGEPFWLDVPESRFDADGAAAKAVGASADRIARFHRRGRRPAAIVEQGHAAFVFGGAIRTPDGGVARVETMVFATGNQLVTLRDMPCPPLDELRAGVQAGSRAVDALLVLDALTSSLLNVTEEIQDEVEGVENRVLEGASEEMLGRLRFLRQGLSVLLRLTHAQHVLVTGASDELAGTPGVHGQAARRVRDLVAHLALAADLVESTREAIGEALDISLSMTSNRLGEAAERLSAIATIVLPATIVTGFFGMNFTWLTDRLTSFWTFAVYGVGGMTLSIAIAYVYLRARRLD